MANTFEDLVISLFGCIFSTADNEAKGNIADALYKLGSKKPSVVLSAAHTYLIQNNKLNNQHRAVVLNTITKIIQKSNAVELLEEQQILLIINLATQEMTMSKDGNEVCAEAAKDLLVTLGKYDKFVGNVMDALLLKFPPGLSIPPSRHVILSMALISQNNPFGFVPFLTDVLSRTTSLLSHLKQDSVKSAWAQSLSMFCESLVEFSSTNKQKESDEPTAQKEDQITPALIDNDLKQNYSDQMEAVYEVVFSWIYSKDYKCRADTAECVGSLCLIISKEKINRDLKKLVTAFLYLYKKITVPAEQYALTRGVANFLELCCSDDTLPIENYLDDIFNCLFGHVCLITEQSLSTGDSSKDPSNNPPNPITMKIRNEAFRCFHVAARRFADKLVYYLLHKMQSDKDPVKLGSTNLMRHLLNSAANQMEDKKSLITMGLKPLLLDENLTVRVKMSICQLCVALADHGYVQNEGGGEHVVKFLMRNLIPSEDPNAPSTTPARISRQDFLANAQFHSQCSKALVTIAKTCESATELLWQYLFEFLCVESYTPVLGDLCKCLKILIIRHNEEAGEEKRPDLTLTLNTDENPKLPGPHQVFARLIVCLNGAALNPGLNRRAVEIISLMRELHSWFNSALTEVLPERLENLTKVLEELGTSPIDPATLAKEASPTSDHTNVALKCARTQRWQSAILEVLGACIQSVIDGDWREKLAAALAQQLKLYTHQPQDKCFLLRVIGFSLSRVANTAFVIDHVYLAFKSANHGNQNERMGCALLMGHCAQVHTELVLTELENISKWEHSKKSGAGLFSYIKEATYGKGSETDEIINLRATIILSYGYVMLYCPVDLVVQRLEKTVLPFLRQYLAGFKAETVIKEAHLDTINLIASTVHSSHLNTDYKFESRFECISYIKQYIKAETPESLSTWVRLLAAKATASLAKLDPPLSDNEIWDVGNVLAKSIFPICRESGLKTPLVEHDFSTDPRFHYRSPTVKAFRRSASSSSSNSLNSSSDQLSSEFFSFFIENQEAATMMDATVDQYRSAICQIILKKPILQTVSQLLKMFQSFYGSASDHERIRSTETTVLILQVYLNNLSDTKLGIASDFPPLCSILGRLAPRLADSVGAVRHAAIRSIWLAFRLSLLHGGHSPLETDILDAKLFDLKAFIENHLGDEGRVDSQISRNAITAIAKEIESRLPQTQAQTYLSVLFKMVTDEQNNVGSGAAQLLAIMLEGRGHMLSTEAELIFKTILENLPRVHAIDMTYKNLLSAFRLLAAHQQITSVDVLLQQSLPYSIQVKGVWKELAQEASQFYLIADYLLDLFGFPSSLNDTDSASNDQLSVDSQQASTQTSSTNPTRKFFEIVDAGPGASSKLISSHLCALLAALKEIIANGEPENALVIRVPNFLASLFCALTAIIDAQYPYMAKESNVSSTRNAIITSELCRVTNVPVNLVVDAIKTLVNRLQMNSIVETMNSGRSWTNLANNHHYLSAITIFCRSFCDCAPELTLNLMKLLSEKIKPEHIETDRIAAAAILSSLITRCPNKNGEFDLDLLRETFYALSTALSDSNLTVKTLALRGFSCTGTLVDIYSQNEKGTELFQELSNTAVNYAVMALDDSSDRNDQLSVEAVNTIESLVFVLKRQVLEDVLAKLLLKIRPCFEKDNTALRIVAFSLFGKLGLRVGHSDMFRESLHSNIVSVLLHLNDSDKDVCAQALKNFESAFTSPQLATLIQEELTNEGPLNKYVGFLEDFSKTLAISFPDRTNYYSLNALNYFKSQSPLIRANAAYMVGFLIEALTPTLRQTISKSMIFSGFSQLLTNSDNGVRLAAANAITSMSNFSDEDSQTA